MKPTKKFRILVVDDEIHLREIVAYDLERAGYEVIQAANGKEASQIVDQQAVDLVVSDVRMPSGTGVDLLGWIRAKRPAQPGFIFMTAFSDISSVEALGLGAEAFLRKPIDKAELLEEVEKALVPRLEKWSGPAAETDAGARTIGVNADDFSAQPADHDQSVVVGQGGMFLALEDGLPACFEVVQFNVQCPEVGGMLAGLGRIRWVRHEASHDLPAGVGVEFMTLEGGALQLVRAYLERKRPAAYIPLGQRERRPA